MSVNVSDDNSEAACGNASSFLENKEEAIANPAYIHESDNLQQRQFKLFISNIPFKASRKNLLQKFEVFGDVANVRLVRDQRSGHSKGFGFVQFSSFAAYKQALSADKTKQLELFGRQMRVFPAVGRIKRRAAATVQNEPESEPTVSTSHFNSIPVELLSRILSQLPLKQLVRVSRVCHLWCSVVNQCLASLKVLDLKDVFNYVGAGRLTDKILKKLLRRAPNVQRLLTGGHARSCSHSALYLIAERCPQLIEIDLTGFSIDERALQNLCKRCPRLQLVHLPDHYHFSESSVWVLLRHLTCLRRLDLNRSNCVTGKCFSIIPPSIEQLVLNDCSGIESENLAQLADRQLVKLHSLDITSVTKLTADHCRRMLTGLPALQRLSMAQLSLPLDRCLSACTNGNLSCLDIGFSAALDDDTLRNIVSMLSTLSELDLQGCDMLTETGLLHLQRLERLSRLDISYIAGVNDSVLFSLFHLPLMHLYLAESYTGAAHFTSDGLRQLIANCRQLKLLDLSCVNSICSQALRSASRERVSAVDLEVRLGGTECWLHELMADATTSPVVDVQQVQLENGVCALDYNSVPLHLRLFDDTDLPDWEDASCASDQDVYEDWEEDEWDGMMGFMDMHEWHYNYDDFYAS